ncbi:MAG: ATP-dependent helicase HrpB, partial [Desulfuromonadales bacterium]|nr:ATP-dependent helicase HrpB [Desulfuromonadales bacterium]NIR32958.1 ATP-dependent helicase HrpB [Desulfuromonadales bacterium]NIS40516.1 ATP-dependent helicase HrpB [Desulfuromonadales bacterium]
SRHPGAARRSGSDLLDRLEVYRRQPKRFPAVQRAARYWRQRFAITGEKASAATERQVGELLAAGWPDRIAMRREGEDSRYLLSSGQGALLSPESAVGDAPLLVAVEMGGAGRGEGRIRVASSLEFEDLRRLFADRLEQVEHVFWDEKKKRVVAREEERFGALVLRQRPIKASDGKRLEALLSGIRAMGLDCLNWTRAAKEMVARVQFVKRAASEGGWPDLSEKALLSDLEEWLAPFLGDLGTAAALARVDLVEPLKARLGWQRQQELDRLAPTHLQVPSGSRIRLDYPAEGPPVLAVKLQELFGLADTPRVVGGRVPVVIHLLSPARRPLSVTQDLRNFWEEVYPEVKKEMKGRYPKHPWPDDPWEAEATRRTKRRG